MKGKKGTAIWEEDGDLMRVKEYFNYIYQNQNVKSRIKQKTLAKISPDGELASGTELAAEIKNAMSEDKPVSFAGRWQRRLPRGKTALKVFSAAAAVILAVYLGSTGLHKQDQQMQRIAGNNTAATQESGAGGGGLAAPQPGAVPAAKSPSMPEEEMYSTAQDSLNSGDTSAAKGLDGSPAARNLDQAQPAVNQAENGSAQTSQKIIYTMDLTIKVKEVPSAVNALEKKTVSVGGYVADSSQNNDNNQAAASMTLRIPAANFQKFKDELPQFGTVANQHLYTDDVSYQYFDVETRLKSWEAQEKRYLEILQQAKSVEDILRIEESLSNVRREMESLKGQLKYWDNRVQYSEIRINLTQIQTNYSVEDPWHPLALKDTFQAAKNAVVKTISLIWNALNYLLIFIGYLVPAVLLLGLGWGSWCLVKKYRKRKE